MTEVQTQYSFEGRGCKTLTIELEGSDGSRCYVARDPAGYVFAVFVDREDAERWSAERRC